MASTAAPPRIANKTGSGGHLLEIDIPPNPEQQNGQPQRDQSSRKSEGRNPPAHFLLAHGKDAQDGAARRAQTTEDQSVDKRTIPEHLRFRTESARANHRGLNTTNQDPGENARTHTQTGRQK